MSSCSGNASSIFPLRPNQSDAVSERHEPGRCQLRPTVVLLVGADEQPADRLLPGLVQVPQHPRHDEDQQTYGTARERRPSLISREIDQTER